MHHGTPGDDFDREFDRTFSLMLKGFKWFGVAVLSCLTLFLLYLIIGGGWLLWYVFSS